ncbi:hypothetical protein JD969_02265 [Planctomycetota bacterium]|nr:hypothetical protein JD969_02265 [Planctomycetota bacterium]
MVTLLLEEDPTWVGEVIQHTLSVWYTWLISFADSIVKPLMIDLIEKIPIIPIVPTGIDEMLSIVNYWLPVTEFVHCFELYITFTIAFIAIKYPIKWLLPGLG